MQFQQKQMARLCHRYSHRPPPVPGTYDHSILTNHLLYDDEKKLVYCYAPKTGCTNMKQSFVQINGIYTHKELQTLNVTHEDHLYKAHSLAKLSSSQRNYRLNNYFKFTVVRNPLERLLSAWSRYLSPLFHKVPFLRKLQTLELWCGHLLDIPLSYFSNQVEHQQNPTLDLLPMYYSFVKNLSYSQSYNLS